MLLSRLQGRHAGSKARPARNALRLKTLMRIELQAPMCSKAKRKLASVLGKVALNSPTLVHPSARTLIKNQICPA